ncbi:MAG TPA: cytochrome c [Vicinamibacterales bacterium]|nr:cytochrome c [Vicinamibacterales bacterium]
MRAVLLLSVLAFPAAITAIGIQPRARGRNASAPVVRLDVELPADPTAGARLFAEKRCVRCHALGAGESRVGPDLGRIHLPGTVLDLAGAFWNHAAVMREKMRELKIPAPVLDSREMADLVAFLTAYRYYLAEIGEPGNPTRGREVFRAKGCGRCHGRPGDWGKPAPSLERYRGRFSAISMAASMWNHGVEMAALMRRTGVRWPRFEGREMGDLLAFLQAGTGGRGADRVYFEPGSPRRGRELFATKRCIDCHAIGGAGGRGGPDLGARGREMLGPVASIAGLMWNHSHRMSEAFRRRGIPRIVFSGQEMADVIAYLYFVNYAVVYGAPARGARLFADKCSTCHTIGGGRRVGPDLGTAPGLDEPIAIIATMWNHAPQMEEQLRRRGLVWPRFGPGEAADLAAFLLVSRGRIPPPAPSRTKPSTGR